MKGVGGGGGGGKGNCKKLQTRRKDKVYRDRERTKIYVLFQAEQKVGIHLSFFSLSLQVSSPAEHV